MDGPPFRDQSEAAGSATGERLDSWKEIAVYLGRSVRTLHRWEKDEGLPVHRLLHKDLGSVFAYKSELDAWSRSRSARADPTESHPARASHVNLVRIVALTAAAAVVTATAFHVASRPAPAGRDRAVAGLELISARDGSQRSPSLSPDGRLVAFVREAAGTPQIWVRSLERGDPVQITFGTFPAVRPRWSREGDRILYSTRGAGIWSVAPLGGDRRRIVENGWNAELSPDGERLVFERRGQILVAAADGTDIRPLSNLPLSQHYGDAWPTFSPDGRWIAAFIGETGRFGDYWLIPAAGGQPRRLTHDVAEGGAPAWTPDARFLVFPSTRAGALNLWRVAIAGGVPEALTTGPGDDLDPVVAPDGGTLLFTNVKRTWTLVLHDLESGRQKILVEQRLPLVFPAFSLDGRRIAYQAKDALGAVHLVAIEADGSNTTHVTEGAGEVNIMPQWASDAESLYFYQVRPRETFRRISIRGGASREIAPWSWNREPFAAVSGHGRLAVHSVLDGGRLLQSRVRDLDNGTETALPFALFLHRYSRDGRWLAGESRDGEAVVCEVSSSRCRSVTPKDPYGLAALAWSGDGTRLFLLRHTSAQVFGELASVGVDAGVVKTHATIGPFQHAYLMSMDASPRDEIIFVRCLEGPHELWRARLR